MPPQEAAIAAGNTVWLDFAETKETFHQFLWICFAKSNCLLLILLYQFNTNPDFKTSERQQPYFGVNDRAHMT